MKKKFITIIGGVIISTLTFQTITSAAHYFEGHNTNKDYYVQISADGPYSYVDASTSTKYDFDLLTVDIYNENRDKHSYNQATNKKTVSVRSYVNSETRLTVSHKASDSSKGFLYITKKFVKNKVN